MKFSKFLNKGFDNKETYEKEKEDKIQELFNENISNYNILKATVTINEEDGEEDIYIISDMNNLDDYTIREAIENNSYDYCYNHILYELEQYIWEGLYDFTENINENWDELKEISK